MSTDKEKPEEKPKSQDPVNKEKLEKSKRKHRDFIINQQIVQK